MFIFDIAPVMETLTAGLTKITDGKMDVFCCNSKNAATRGLKILQEHFEGEQHDTHACMTVRKSPFAKAFARPISLFLIVLNPTFKPGHALPAGWKPEYFQQ